MPEYPAVTGGPSCRGHLALMGAKDHGDTHFLCILTSPGRPVCPMPQRMRFTSTKVRFTGFLVVKPTFGKKDVFGGSESLILSLSVRTSYPPNIFHNYLKNCGKIYMKFAIVIILKCTSQWHLARSHGCATGTTMDS